MITNFPVTLVFLFALSACAGSVNPPTLKSGPAGVDASRVPLGQVSGEAALGVEMIPQDVVRISRLVQAKLMAEYASRIVAAGLPAPPGAVNIKLLFTEFDKGNAFARAMLAGLGSMHIHANVILVDARTGAPVATYEAIKDFAWGGLYGGSTTIEDLEDGFATSVAAIFKT